MPGASGPWQLSQQRWGELSPEAVIRKFRITAADGKSDNTQHCHLEVVISVG
jgi:hypothetical protein